MVRAVRSYEAQTVRGGLGTGGRLGVDGGSTPASREINSR
ncbi:MAG TPA: peptidoglycan-binding protein, partial [Gammaproteobacteria bacterium]|nr:peptidoglycan-binding protein [Gammaproteobacteria bacterium]